MTTCIGCPWPESPDCFFCQQEVTATTIVNSPDGTVVRKSHSRNNHHNMVKERRQKKSIKGILKNQKDVKARKAKKKAKRQV